MLVVVFEKQYTVIYFLVCLDNHQINLVSQKSIPLGISYSGVKTVLKINHNDRSYISVAL